MGGGSIRVGSDHVTLKGGRPTLGGSP